MGRGGLQEGWAAKDRQRKKKSRDARKVVEAGTKRK